LRKRNQTKTEKRRLKKIIRQKTSEMKLRKKLNATKEREIRKNVLKS
jgi:hypothetical protein